VGKFPWRINSDRVDFGTATEPWTEYILVNAFCDICYDVTSVEECDQYLLKHYKSIKATKNDQNKTQWSLLLNKDFIPLLDDVIKILQSGAAKYSEDNWKGLDKERLENAILRHILAYMSGDRLDKETNKSHLLHALTNILFIEYKNRF
jgi:hypothetical protein